MSLSLDRWKSLTAWLEELADDHFSSYQSSKNHESVRFARNHDGDELGVFVIHNEETSLGEWAFVGVRVAPVHQFDLDALLSGTTFGPIGAFSLAADYLCVSHNVPLEGLEPTKMLTIISGLCDIAASCKASIKPPDHAAAFSYLAD